MNLTLARTVLFAAGFMLWALTSVTPLAVSEGIREGWDRPIYWQIGLPLVLAVQLLMAVRSSERVAIAPLWVMFGHVAAMVFIHPAGTSLGLLPLAIVIMGLPLYAMLLAAACVGRMLRRLMAPL